MIRHRTRHNHRQHQRNRGSHWLQLNTRQWRDSHVTITSQSTATLATKMADHVATLPHKRGNNAIKRSSKDKTKHREDAHCLARSEPQFVRIDASVTSSQRSHRSKNERRQQQRRWQQQLMTEKSYWDSNLQSLRGRWFAQKNGWLRKFNKTKKTKLLQCLPNEIL